MPNDTSSTGSLRSLLKASGSLWFAAVLLSLLLAAMASATIYESVRGSEQGLAFFYGSWWFEALLALVAVNVASAMVLRYPFSRRQTGFVLTHVSILVILGGALVTERLGIDGRVTLFEGDTAAEFDLRDTDGLTISKRSDKARARADLTPAISKRFEPIDGVETPDLALGDVRVEVKRYLPDSIEISHVVNDSPDTQPAVEVSLSAGDESEATWVFAGQTTTLGSAGITFRQVSDPDQLVRLLKPPSTTQPSSEGIVRIDYKGARFELPLADCMGAPAPIGETGLSVRVLRYLPDAMVGPDKKLTTRSDRPLNPAIEAEITGPDQTVKLFAFARFPEFSSMHARRSIEDLRLTFISSFAEVPQVPIELIQGPDDAMYVRFASGNEDVASHALSPGVPVETFWPGFELRMLRRFDHARIERRVEPIEPVREDRIPALLVTLTGPVETAELWVRKYIPQVTIVGGEAYDLAYESRKMPLGFDLTLDKFEIGRWPGIQMERSFESTITVLEPITGRKQSAVISMNHPVKFGSYALYQNAYNSRSGKISSTLSVAWDPGQPVVFTGYVGLCVGMVWILVVRIMSRRRRIRGVTAEIAKSAERRGENE